VHANGETAVRMAVEAGCDSIEHGYFMGPDNLRRMADNGVARICQPLCMSVLGTT
jgi:imidazolonepropionase-like amidohydrolase